MANYKTRGKLVLLDKHLATGTESTYTYTPNTAIDLKQSYREIQIIITGKTTAALGLLLKVNAATSYDITYLLGDTSTLSMAVATGISAHELLSNALLDGANLFNIEVTIVLNDATDELMIKSYAVSPHEGHYHNNSVEQTGATTVTAINVATTTSTWIAGTEITIMGLKR